MRRGILQSHLGLHCLIRPVYPNTYGNTLKIAGLVENRLDADETLHSAVSSGSTLFAQACLSEYIPNRWNSHRLCI